MNAGLDQWHSSITYYDSDYPSPFTSIFPENFDETTKFQGLEHDIDRYLELANEVGGPVLDLCCGTGRVTIPLAREGFSVTGVDINEGMLSRFSGNLEREQDSTREHIQIVCQDLCKLDLPNKDYSFALIAFNSLLCIPTFRGQMQALDAIAQHLKPGGTLVIDIINPLTLKIDGEPNPTPFFTRRNPDTGNTYTRFAMSDAFDAEQRQRLHGWYDEMESDGRLKRTSYSLYWRPIFRFEIELMLEKSGFRLETIEGGHQKEPYIAKSPRMFIVSKALEKQESLRRRC